MTLRLRFGVAVAIVIAVLVSAAIVIPRSVVASQIQQIDQELASTVPQALVVAGGPPAELRLPSIDLKPAPTSASARLSTIYLAFVSGRTRRVLLTDDGNSGAPQLPSATSSIGTRELSERTVGSTNGDGRWRAVLLRLKPTGTKSKAPAEILIAVSMEQADATDADLRLALLAAGLTVLAVLGAVGWWLLRLGLRPISEVTAVADAIASGDRSRRVGQSTEHSEAAHLARAFNVMLDEQQAAEQRLRRFVADASHELRSPVAAIRGISELWRDGILTEASMIGEALRRIGDEAARMSTLVGDLLLLAHLDEQSSSIEHENVNISLVASEAIASAGVTHPTRPVCPEIEGDVYVDGDRSRLRQVITNLVTNALIHTPRGTSIVIRVARRKDACLVEVADDGPGMPSEDAARAFERFWRGDPSRNLPGSGLGLSIVAGIVAAHGGTISMTTAPGAGLKMQIELPLAINQSELGSQIATPASGARKGAIT